MATWKSTNLSNAMLDALFNNTSFAVATPHASLHDDHPANTGANEVTGGTYARQAVTASFPAASGGNISSNAQIQWTLMPATTVYYVGIFSAVTAGTFYGYAPIESVYGYATAQDTGDIFTSYAHGLSNDDRVSVDKSIGQGMPAGPAADTLYHVISSTADTFQISATQGGGAVVLTSDGECVFIKAVGKTTNSGDSVTIASGDLDFFEEQ